MRAVLRKIQEFTQAYRERATRIKAHERVTHLRDQSRQVCSCQWHIAGDLDPSPNGVRVEQTGQEFFSIHEVFCPQPTHSYPLYTHTSLHTLGFFLLASDECLSLARHTLRALCAFAPVSVTLHCGQET